MQPEDVEPLSECERCGGANDHPFNPLCRSCERAEADKDKLWLPELEERFELHNDQGVRFVNVYLEDKGYGGPEEGGWWFDCGELIRCEVWPTEEAAKARAAELEGGEYSNEGRRSRSSVLSEGEYVVGVEAQPGERHWPKTKPRYE